MDVEARAALRVVRECLASGRYRLLRHFAVRMDRRGLFWPDILAIINDPQNVRYNGLDRFNRPKWVVGGVAADNLPVEAVCAIDVDENGDLTVFITMY